MGNGRDRRKIIASGDTIEIRFYLNATSLRISGNVCEVLLSRRFMNGELSNGGCAAYGTAPLPCLPGKNAGGTPLTPAFHNTAKGTPTAHHSQHKYSHGIAQKRVR